jgi:ABC-2 type transport system permease protein
MHCAICGATFLAEQSSNERHVGDKTPIRCQAFHSGITFSTLATNQLQAVQGSFFFFVPSLLLSGFMFPFRGMPVWAQHIGEVLPLTHFLRIIRGVLLKGNTFDDIKLQLWQIVVFAAVALIIGVKRYRQTLD